MAPDHAALNALRALSEPGLPRLLFITHAWGGGVEQHVKSVCALLQDKARVLILRPAQGGGLRIEYDDVSLQLPAAAWEALVEALQALAIDRVHLHHVHGLPPQVLAIDLALAAPLDVTLHDYFAIYPQYQLVDSSGQYCGEPDDDGCAACMSRRPHAWGVSIANWRQTMAQVLQRAQRVWAPTKSVADRIHRYQPDLPIEVLPHPDRPVAPPTIVKAVLLGALSPAKGLNAALAVAQHAKRLQQSADRTPDRARRRAAAGGSGGNRVIPPRRTAATHQRRTPGRDMAPVSGARDLLVHADRSYRLGFANRRIQHRRPV